MRRHFFRWILPSILIAGACIAHAQEAAQADQAEIVFWESIRDSKNRADFEEYLKQYPGGTFAGLARNRIQAMDPPPAPPKPSAPPPPPENRAMSTLPGLWLSLDPNNQFQMAVTWNAARQRFEGTLAAQGRVSSRVGFTVGELIWVATPTANSDVVTEQQMYRTGTFGFSVGYQWLQGTINLNNSSRNDLVTNYARFRRLQ